LSKTRCCPYCQRSFLPSLYRPQQEVCNQPECQRRRRVEYHRKKIANDSEYHQVVLESQKKWRAQHPDYDKQRRHANPKLVENNRERQRHRDQKRRLQRLAKNNLALDLKHSASEVWLLGPKLRNLDKNNLASAQVLILPLLTSVSSRADPS
jgi:hypothetical protein